MGKLWKEFGENLGFVAVCGVIIAGLFLLAKLVERKLPEPRKVSSARRITIISVCGAIASILHILDFLYISA